MRPYSISLDVKEMMEVVPSIEGWSPLSKNLLGVLDLAALSRRIVFQKSRFIRTNTLLPSRFVQENNKGGAFVHLFFGSKHHLVKG